MPISLKGTLLVKKIKHSRNGPFCVADLITEIAEFKVKDQLLDQFEEGEYKGDFVVAEIFMSQYIDSYGRAVTEMRARLQDLQIENHRATPKARAVQEREPDPADERPPVRAPRAEGAKPAINKLKPGPGSGAASRSAGPTAADHELFGDEIFEQLNARADQVKLDKTISDRMRFRRQAERMGQLGYEFDAKTQTYNRKS